MTITAERVGEKQRDGRQVYRLSEAITSAAYPEPFEYVVLSLGRAGDTCVFPSNEKGNILDFMGFGYAWGPSRWLTDGEYDAYVSACIAQHEHDHGAGMKICTEGVYAGIGGSDD